MARTPLLDVFVSLFREYRAAHAAGLPLSGLREQRVAHADTARGLSRRELLASGAAGALALALPQRVGAVGQPTVVVVGAGIAGLTCALELRGPRHRVNRVPGLGSHRRADVHQHELLRRRTGGRVGR